jgi:hypothetical protein
LEAASPSDGPVAGGSEAGSGGAAASPRDGYPKLWNVGDTLRVRFLDGDRGQRELVKRFSRIWTTFANIGLHFVEEGDAEIRVAFTADPGSWSYVGTDALNASSTEPTVNLGWIQSDTPVAIAESTILHEFGHVLGLYEEHQNPIGKIPWDKEAVYKAFEGPPNYWTRDQVVATLFRQYPMDAFPIPKPFDPTSVMAYAMPPVFLNTEFRIGSADTLSRTDKEFIAILYPFDA